MTQTSPDDPFLKSEIRHRNWDSSRVCETLLLWYPELLSPSKLHEDMRNRRKVMEFVACLQEYPAQLQDLLILLAQRRGIRETAMALDNAIRKDFERLRENVESRRNAGANPATVAATARAS